MRPAFVQLTASILATAACAAAAPSLAADLPALRQRGTLRVLVSADEMPEVFSTAAAGEPGLDRELLEAFTRLQRIKLEPVVVRRFDDIIPALVKGDGDVIVGINALESRRKLIDFTVEIHPARHIVVTRKPAPVIAKPEGLRGHKVAVIPDTSWSEAATEAGVASASQVAAPDTPGVLAALKSGKATAAVMALSDFVLMLRKDPDLQGGAFVGKASSAAWGVRKTDPELRRALDEHIENARKSGLWSRLIIKYFGQDALTILGRAQKE